MTVFAEPGPPLARENPDCFQRSCRAPTESSVEITTFFFSDGKAGDTICFLSGGKVGDKTCFLSDSKVGDEDEGASKAIGGMGGWGADTSTVTESLRGLSRDASAVTES